MTTLNAATSTFAKLVGNAVLTKANAVIGATASAFTTGNAITYAIGGVLRSLAAQTNTALTAMAQADIPGLPSNADWRQPSGSVGFYVQPANTTVYYVLAVNASGTVRVVQGTYDGQPLSQLGTTMVGKSVIPDIPDQFVAFAVIKVVTAGSAFTPGTTALTGLATFIDVSVLPEAATF